MSEFPRYFYKRQDCEVLVLALLCFYFKKAWKLFSGHVDKALWNNGLSGVILSGVNQEIDLLSNGYKFSLPLMFFR